MTIETHPDAPAPNPDRGPNARDQRTFDTVARKLARQGRPSAVPRLGGPTMECLYLAPNGDRCAAGHLLDLTDPEMSGLDSHGVMHSPQIQHLLAEAGHDPSFAARMQAAHDEATQGDGGHDPEKWLAAWAVNMRKVARRYGLDTAVLEAELLTRQGATATASTGLDVGGAS